MRCFLVCGKHSLCYLLLDFHSDSMDCCMVVVLSPEHSVWYGVYILHMIFYYSTNTSK